jgi:hypothetical protein
MLEPTQDAALSGSVFVFALYDVCEEINLGELVRVLGLEAW